MNLISLFSPNLPTAGSLWRHKEDSHDSHPWEVMEANKKFVHYRVLVDKVPKPSICTNTKKFLKNFKKYN